MPKRQQGFFSIFGVFLYLGCTSFGGPIAHLAHFRKELIEKRGWLSEDAYASLIAMCNFLPGPSSSQVGFSLGLLRGGWAGGMAAFVAFTLPSSLLMIAFALLGKQLPQDMGNVIVQGLQLVALTLVSHGLAGMAEKLCPNWQRKLLAIIAFVLLLVFGSGLQLWVICLGACAGLVLCRDNTTTSEAFSFHTPYSVLFGVVLLSLTLALVLACTLLFEERIDLVGFLASLLQSGSLVFGGGHVVLPLLDQNLVQPGLIHEADFVAGYGAAQAIPGPIFTIAAYYGSVFAGEHMVATVSVWLVAVLALIAIFLPGLAMAAASMPLWQRMQSLTYLKAAFTGINAVIVGVLGAALYNPVALHALTDIGAVVIAASALAMMFTNRVPVLVIIAWCVTGSLALSHIG